MQTAGGSRHTGNILTGSRHSAKAAVEGDPNVPEGC